uniref:Uncharacterized protein n=1 Tax=Arundo donax TaxID=35708 RepID=A0A0A9C2Y7_ARUDO
MVNYLSAYNCYCIKCLFLFISFWHSLRIMTM